MLFHRLGLLPLIATSALALQAVGQSAPPKVAIPEFPGATSSATAPSIAAPAPTVTAPVAPENTTSVAPAPSESVAAPQTLPAPTPVSLEETPAVKPARKLTKAEEKAERKRQKEAEKRAKDAKEEKKFLKLQGGDLVAPTLDADGNPIHLAPCSKKDKVCQKKRKALLKRKTVGMKIENGTLTVDGWTGKARMNYDISEVKFLYVWAPGIGTTVISNQNFPGAKEEKNAVVGNTLTVTTEDNHQIQLTSENPLMDKKKDKKGLSLWVATDPDFNLSSRYPAFGYGSTAKAPYNWPGARPFNEKELKLIAHAPPLPKGMEPRQMELPCVNARPGEEIKPVKLNGFTYTPRPCPVKAQVAEASPVPDEKAPTSAATENGGVDSEAHQK